MVIKNKKIEKIVLLGGGNVLINISLWLIKKNIPVKVITSLRHSEEVIDGLKFSCLLAKNNIPFLITEDVSSVKSIDFIGDTENVFALSLGAAWIFKKTFIKNVFNDLLFNVHSTRLPQNRGGGGFSWQVMNGSRFGFCQLHLIDGGIDTGPLVLSEEFLYPQYCRIPFDFEQVLQEKNFNFIKKFILKIWEKPLDIQISPQAEYFSTYWPRLNTDINGWIDWNYSVTDLERFICAFDDPYAGAQSCINGKEVRIKKVSVDCSDGIFHSYQRGIVYRKNDDWICVASIGGSLIIEGLEDQEANKILSEVNVGDRFITPTVKLEKAFGRVVYTPNGLKT